jgi:hypothetical protein
MGPDPGRYSNMNLVRLLTAQLHLINRSKWIFPDILVDIKVRACGASQKQLSKEFVGTMADF